MGYVKVDFVTEEGREGPICPHCEEELEVINAMEMSHDMGKAYINYCPHCRKVLGTSHRKGFWMG